MNKYDANGSWYICRRDCMQFLWEDGKAHILQPTKEKAKNGKENPISELLSGKWQL